MAFHSILFRGPEDEPPVEGEGEPAFFRDLNLHHVVASLTAGREGYDLAPFFSMPLRGVDAVAYRHEVMRDLQGGLRAPIESFAEAMRAMREHLAQADRLYYEYQQQAWFVDAVAIYGEAVGRLAEALSEADVRSRGLRAFGEYLRRHAASREFRSLLAETRQVKSALSAVRYRILIRGRRVTVRRYEEEPDYSAEVLDTFRRFQQGVVRDYRVRFPEHVNMNHVEAAVLDLVARLHPDVFDALRRYCARYRGSFLDSTIGRFDREVQFYLAYLDLMRRLRAAGLSFSYPVVSERSKEVCARDTFDLALADKLVRDGSPVVCNDVLLDGPERILVISGPNQGGKTTFARTFGQLHHLARLGLPVPGTESRLFLCDRIFTHFEREEHIETLRGKLEDELLRIRDILREATRDSVVIMNESFASTTLNDNLLLARRVLGQIMERDLLCVYVTFIDELSTLGPATVSMVSTVEPENPALRTYRVVRRPADGLAYAAAIAARYGLTYRSVKRRIAP
jgi:DNA mismatch repair protein MutS